MPTKNKENNQPKTGTSSNQLPKTTQLPLLVVPSLKSAKAPTSAKLYSRETQNFLFKTCFSKIITTFLSKHVHSLKYMMHPWNGYSTLVQVQKTTTKPHLKTTVFSRPKLVNLNPSTENHNTRTQRENLSCHCGH